MKNLYLKLIVEMLRDYSDELSNHGCNDYDLEGHMPNVQDRRRFMKEYYEYNGEPNEYDPKSEYKYFFDWGMASFLADKLEKEIRE